MADLTKISSLALGLWLGLGFHAAGALHSIIHFEAPCFGCDIPVTSS